MNINIGQMSKNHLLIESRGENILTVFTMSYDFSGKVALVTGAASGIGLGYTKSLLKKGVKGVAVVDKDRENGEKIQKELGKKILFIKTDVVKKDELKAAFEETIKKFGHIDIVINNAGAFREDNWDLTISVNVNAVIQGVLFGFQYMGKDKGGRGGVILNTASVLGIQGGASCPVYGGTKAFVINFGKAMGTDCYCKDAEIRVLTLCPGPVDTPMVKTVTFLEGFNISPDLQRKLVATFEMQSPEYLGDSMIEIIKRGKNGSCWIVNNNEPIYEFEFPKLF